VQSFKDPAGLITKPLPHEVHINARNKALALHCSASTKPPYPSYFGRRGWQDYMLDWWGELGRKITSGATIDPPLEKATNVMFMDIGEIEAMLRRPLP
jgi:hypothetical protein